MTQVQPRSPCTVMRPLIALTGGVSVPRVGGDLNQKHAEDGTGRYMLTPTWCLASVIPITFKGKADGSL